MTHELAERCVKSVQKEFLSWMEDHPDLFFITGPDRFNQMRRSVFRGTFEAFRLGIVGLDTVKYEELQVAFSYLDPWDKRLPLHLQKELAQRCFVSALVAFRFGALVDKIA